MPARSWTIVGFVLIALCSATDVSASWFFGIFESIGSDIMQRNRWPEPYTVCDQAAAVAPYCVMVTNGWRRQNMLGEYHFLPGTSLLTEAGRMKVRWILTPAPSNIA